MIAAFASRRSPDESNRRWTRDPRRVRHPTPSSSPGDRRILQAGMGVVATDKPTRRLDACLARKPLRGGLLLAVQIPERLLPHVRPCALFFALSPFVLAVMSGLASRILMSRLLLANDRLSLERSWELVILPLKGPIKVKDFGEEMIRLTTASDPQSDRLAAVIAALSWICTGFFAIGLAAIFALLLAST